MGKEGETQDSTQEDSQQDPLEDKGQSQDPLADKGQESDPLEQQEETQDDKPQTRTSAPDTNADLAQAINKLSDSLARPGLTAEQQEQLWQKAEAESGMTRQQLVYQDQQTRRTAVLANLETNKELGRLKVEKILEDETMVADVEKTMAALPPEIQGNPKAWEDAAYLVLGRKTKMGSAKKDDKSGANTQTRRVIGGSSTTTRNTTTSKQTTTPKQYSPMEQSLIARQFGGKAEEYEKYKAKTSVSTDSRITAAQGSNNADQELQRLTANNT